MGTVGGAEADSSAATPSATSATDFFSVFSQPEAGRLEASAREDFFEVLPPGIDRERFRTLGDDLGDFDSTLGAVPVAPNRICYGLRSDSPQGAGGAHCFRPLAYDEPGGGAGRHFSVYGSEVISRETGAARVTLFGIAFDDVEAVRVNITGGSRARRS